MEYFVLRLYCDGCRIQKVALHANRVRGSLSIKSESTGRRESLVARINPLAGSRPIPPLFDASLAGMSGESWVLTGFEKIEAGPLRRECLVGQVWLAEPAAMQDLIDVEAKWATALTELERFRQATKTAQPVPLPGPMTR
jgi:hypothetical protein